MSHPGPEPRPPWLEEAYALLTPILSDNDVEIPVSEASLLLHAEASFDGSLEDAEYAVEYLIQSGDLYSVDGKLFLTEPTA